MTIYQVGIDDICRFWQFVDRKGPDECWPWKSQPGRRYGNFSIGKKNISPHRFSYLIHNKELPDHLLVLHSCDYTFCVNPAHLRAGTQLENRQQCVAKGRQAIGINHGKSVLTPEKVRVVRQKKLEAPWTTNIELGRLVDCAPGTISNILNGRTWAWLE